MTETEAECRRSISAAWLHYEGPDAPPYYVRLTDWYAELANAQLAHEAQCAYVNAMQRDPRLD